MVVHWGKVSGEWAEHWGWTGTLKQSEQGGCVLKSCSKPSPPSAWKPREALELKRWFILHVCQSGHDWILTTLNYCGLQAWLKMCWYNFFLQNSDYKSHIYKDWWHPACHQNIWVAISFLINRNLFISYPSTGASCSPEIRPPSLSEKNAHLYFIQAGKWVGQEAGSTTIAKVWYPWHIKIKLLTPEIQRKYVFNHPLGFWGLILRCQQNFYKNVLNFLFHSKDFNLP